MEWRVHRLYRDKLAVLLEADQRTSRSLLELLEPELFHKRKVIRHSPVLDNSTLLHPDRIR